MFFWKKSLKLGDTYGVLDGQYQGHTLMFIKKHGELYGFCDIFGGNMTSRWIPIKEVDFALKHDILELVKPQPTNEIKKIAKSLFEKNEKGV